jgi:hypothetical protein
MALSPSLVRSWRWVGRDAFEAHLVSGECVTAPWLLELPVSSTSCRISPGSRAVGRDEA